ncbi:MAG: FAD-dependent oxidoreductase [Chloroflexi bacterium]|nr:FAD-dependent oxidoreductase [Chloroflexota bacterium]
MQSTKYLIIGGGMAALEAAKQLRKADATASITLVSEERLVPYNRPPLSKHFLRGEMPLEKVLLAPEAWYRENNITVLLGTKGEGLDPAKATVSLSNGETCHYEKLLIATGGEPVRLTRLAGSNLGGIHYLRTVEDAQAIGAEALPGKRAVLVGAGFIGLEVAASLAKKGVQVTVLEALPHIWPKFAGAGLAGFVKRYCEERGVRFVTGDGVESFDGSGRVASVKTQSREYPCDFVVVGVGIRPRTEVAIAGGVRVDNGIVVDEKMHTSHPNIFAAGDVVNYPDPVFGKRRRVEHWGHAEYTGQIAGMNMAGKETPYNLLTYVWSDIFDLHLEFAGDESEHDQALVRGKMEDKAFVVLYLKQHVLRAYFSVNTSAKEFPVFQRLIQRKTDLSTKLAQLQDAAFNVRGLLS